MQSDQEFVTLGIRKWFVNMHMLVKFNAHLMSNVSEITGRGNKKYVAISYISHLISLMLQILSNHS